VDEAELLGLVERAAEARLLAETPDGLRVRFAHALIHQALYESLPPSLRRHLHRGIGEALLPTGGQAGPDPDAVAYHLRQAGDPRATEWLVRAGERAQATYAWLTAADRYEAALGLLERRGGDAGERGWLTMRLASLRRYGDARRALDDAAAAERLAAEAGDRLLAGLTAFRRGNLLGGFLGRFQHGIPMTEAALAALAALPAAARVPPGEAAPIEPALRWGTVAQHRAWSGRYAEAVALGERYLAEVPAPATLDWFGGNPHADAHLGLGVAYAALGDAGRALASFARAREGNRAVGHHAQAALAASHALGMAVRYQADRPTEVRRVLAEATTPQERLRGVNVSARPQMWTGHVALVAGDWAEAQHIAEGVRATWWPGILGYVEAGLALATLGRARGDAALARNLVAEALPGGADTEPGDCFFTPALATIAVAADLALDAGNLAEAGAWLEAYDRWLAWSGTVLGQAEGALGWAAYYRAAGDRAQARAHAERALAHASDPRQPLALLAIHRLLGEIDTAGGRYDEAAAHLDQALALAEVCGAPYERALTLLALADLRVSEGQPEQATAALEEARGLLEPLEARPALARADSIAVAFAAHAAPAPSTVPGGLSPREVEVLRLVAQGLSDAQVADRLFLSPYTVKAHLRSIYNKLGVPSRAAATRFAVEQGMA
jgi:DNA-binding CsgD family transcriptional regulator